MTYLPAERKEGLTCRDRRQDGRRALQLAMPELRLNCNLMVVGTVAVSRIAAPRGGRCSTRRDCKVRRNRVGTTLSARTAGGPCAVPLTAIPN